MRPRRFTRWLTILAVSVLLGACGFQPRGQAGGVSTLPGPIAITGIRVNSPLYREIRKQVTAADQSLSENSGDAALVLRIRDYQSDSRVLSVDSRNRAVEYELEESLRFTLTDSSGATLLPEQSLSTLRILFRPSDAILSSDRESELLRADMRRDLTTRMLRRMEKAN